jgi:hypothetical protein
VGEDELNCGGSTYSCQSGADVFGGIGQIPSTWLCDGEEDCTSGEDESWCTICFLGSGLIHATQLCNGVYECEDLTDEFEALCDPSSAPPDPPADCDALANRACDGAQDCPGNIDEIGCSTNRCVDSLLPFPDAFKCDGFPDCADGTDENGCSSG